MVFHDLSSSPWSLDTIKLGVCLSIVREILHSVTFLKPSLLSLFIIPHCFFRVRPPFGDSQAKVCELRNAADSLSGADHLHVLSDSGHNARHVQSRDIRVAHVPCVCVLRVRRVLSKPLNLVNPLLSQCKMAHIQTVKRRTVMFNFCFADCCWDAA